MKRRDFLSATAILSLLGAAPALAQGRLREIIPAHHEGAASLAQQMVWIVRLKERHMPARVRRVIQWFLEMHSELRPVPEELLR